MTRSSQQDNPVFAVIAISFTVLWLGITKRGRRSLFPQPSYLRLTLEPVTNEWLDQCHFGGINLVLEVLPVVWSQIFE